ncbi:MAG: hypothetical protein KBC78_04405 [Candidatus Pacebacteria bacterium]|nr:hypothetical protein [Candidatus Paceibacterota bacterium]
MDQEQISAEGIWTKRQRNILLIFVFLAVLVGAFLLLILPKLKTHYIPVPVYQTIGLPSNNHFQFTISPDDNWIVYLDEVYPYYDRHNIVVYSIPNDKKWTLVLSERDSELVRFGLSNNCWTIDSKICVLKNEVSGHVDFSGTEPKFSLGEINVNQFTCSDCEISESTDYFSDFSDGSRKKFISPDGRFIAETVSHGTGFVSPPKLYITDTQNNSKVFIASNVYYDMHFTSDSKRLYYYACKYGGGCDKYKDHLFYIDLEKNTSHRSLIPYDKNINPGTYYPQYTIEEETAALDLIYSEELAVKNDTLRFHYDLFVETFEKPQKIIGLQGNRLVTEDYYQLALSWNTVLPDPVSVELSNLVESLIGEEVTVAMPSYEEFIKIYKGADKYDHTVQGETLWIHDGDGKEIKTVDVPADKVYNKKIGIINADIYYKGELLNDRYR